MKVLKKQQKHLSNFIMRSPTERDANMLVAYMNELSEEKTYIAFQGEQMTEKEILAYIKKVKDNTRNKKEVCLLMFDGRELVGMADVTLRQKIYSHIGNISITIKKNFRGKGLGRLLTEELLVEAVKLNGIKKVVLQVFENNIPAIALYKKMGFLEYGRLPKAIKWRGRYVDEILMYRDIKRR